MTGKDRIHVLIYGQPAHIAWCTTGLAEKTLTERHFVTDAERLAEVLRSRVPEIALVSCEDATICGNTIAVCRRANPGIVVIVVKAADHPVSPDEEVSGSIFAVVSHDIDSVELGSVLKRAIAFVLERRELQQKSDRRRQRRESPASWLMEREARERDNKLEFATSLIRNILHSASQGLGIGSVLTYIDLLQMMMPQLQRDNEVFASLLTNARAARAWLSSFEHILGALQKKYPREVVHGADFTTIVEQSVAETEKFRVVKGQSLDKQHLQDIGSVHANRHALADILSELLLNAYKYSPAESRVSIMSYTTPEVTAITVVNEAGQATGTVVGVPPELEEKVFEPFFRLNNTMDDRYSEQKYGLGIGLTLAEHAALQCGGRLYLYEMESAAHELAENETPARRVIAELVLQKVRES